MKIFFLLLAVFLVGTNCNKKKFFDGPSKFSDDFEFYLKLDDLLLEDDVLWSFTQETNQGNSIQVDSSFAHSGNQSLKFFATKGSDASASKSSLAKQNMAFWKGETVQLSAWYYISGNEDLNWLFLMDLEEQASIGAGPGMRLALVDNQLRIEHKFYEKDIEQTNDNKVDFPRNEWVKITWEVRLSRKKKGSVKLWQNEKLIIDSDKNRTLPNDFLYFQQGTKGMYSSVEIGITANSKENETTIWVDDFYVEKID